MTFFPGTPSTLLPALRLGLLHHTIPTWSHPILSTRTPIFPTTTVLSGDLPSLLHHFVPRSTCTCPRDVPRLPTIHNLIRCPAQSTTHSSTLSSRCHPRRSCPATQSLLTSWTNNRGSLSTWKCNHLSITTSQGPLSPLLRCYIITNKHRGRSDR